MSHFSEPSHSPEPRVEEMKHEKNTRKAEEKTKDVNKEPSRKSKEEDVTPKFSVRDIIRNKEALTEPLPSEPNEETKCETEKIKDIRESTDYKTTAIKTIQGKRQEEGETTTPPPYRWRQQMMKKENFNLSQFHSHHILNTMLMATLSLIELMIIVSSKYRTWKITKML